MLSARARQDVMPDVVHLYSEHDFREAMVSAKGFEWSELQDNNHPAQVQMPRSTTLEDQSSAPHCNGAGRSAFLLAAFVYDCPLANDVVEGRRRSAGACGVWTSMAVTDETKSRTLDLLGVAAMAQLKASHMMFGAL